MLNYTKSSVLVLVFALIPLLDYTMSPKAQESVKPMKQEKFFLTSDGTKIHYLIGGTGPRTLVFVPGWLMPAEIFQMQFNHFVKTYRVISFSPRSQGKSDIYLGKNLAQKRAQDIHELLQETQAKNISLIGWSLGVLETLDYVSRYGTHGLQSLVLIDNSIGEGTPPIAQKKSATIHTTEQFTQYTKNFIAAIFHQPIPAELLQMIEHSTLRLAHKPAQAFAILKKPYPREYYRETIYASQIPVWYAITPRYREQATLFNQKYPLGQLKIYEKNAGHALFIDQAEDFNRDLEHFLKALN